MRRLGGVDGNERLTGQFVTVAIEEASSFTLFGRVETGEHVGGAGCCETETLPTQRRGDAETPRRIGLPLV